MGISIYAIGDLHLSSAVNKPMDVFGGHWTDHWTKIKEDWISRVGPEDIVLIPGDISWAMNLDDAKPDLDSIGSLLKIMIRGIMTIGGHLCPKLSILPPSSRCCKTTAHYGWIYILWHQGLDQSLYKGFLEACPRYTEENFND